MKTKLLVGILSLNIFVAVRGQQKVIENNPHSFPTFKSTNQSYPVKNVPSANKTAGAAAADSGWINYGHAMDFSIQGTTQPVFYGTALPLCTDSSMLYQYSNGYFGISNNEVGDILDVESPVWSNVGYFANQWTSWNSFAVDSMGIAYQYARTLPGSVADTLVVYLYTAARNSVTGPNLTDEYFEQSTDPAIVTNYGDTIVRFKDMWYNYIANTPAAISGSSLFPISGLITMKIPLNISDTITVGYKVKSFAVNNGNPLNVTGNNKGTLVVAAYTFKPGYAYSLGTHINTKNTFLDVTFPEQPNNAGFPQYSACANVSGYYAGCDFNCSSVVESGQRYNEANDGWDAQYIPSYAFNNPAQFEHQGIWYYVRTTSPLGVNELGGFVNGIKLGQNQPNPFNNTTLINYEIASSASVTLSVYDITGRKIMFMDEGIKSAGKQYIEISADKLTSGIYFYTLTAGNNQLTKKMTVVNQ